MENIFNLENIFSFNFSILNKIIEFFQLSLVLTFFIFVLIAISLSLICYFVYKNNKKIKSKLLKYFINKHNIHILIEHLLIEFNNDYLIERNHKTKDIYFINFNNTLIKKSKFIAKIESLNLIFKNKFYFRSKI